MVEEVFRNLTGTAEAFIELGDYLMAAHSVLLLGKYWYLLSFTETSNQCAKYLQQVRLSIVLS